MKSILNLLEDRIWRYGSARLLIIIVRRVVAANNGHGTRASGEVDLSEIMKRKRRLGP
jgi:hypothetical protein